MASSTFISTNANSHPPSHKQKGTTRRRRTRLGSLKPTSVEAVQARNHTKPPAINAKKQKRKQHHTEEHYKQTMILQHSLIEALRAQISEKPHQCPECSMSFKRSDHVRSHIQHKHPALAPSLDNTYCEKCDKSFTRPIYLVRHTCSPSDRSSLPKDHSHRCEQCHVDLSSSSSLTRHMESNKHREGAGRSTNQDLDLIPKEGSSLARPSSRLSVAYPNASAVSTWSAPAVDQAPVFSRDLGAIGSQSDGTSYHSTALEQAPRFFQDPSGVPTQLDPAWLSVDSREQAPTFNQSYGGVTTQLQREDQPSIILAQAPMFSQDIAAAASQSSPVDYQQSFASGKGSGQAAMFSRDHDGVASHHNRINSLSTAPGHDPTYFPVSGVILTQQNSTCYSTATAMQAPVFSRDPGAVRGDLHRPTSFPVSTDQVSASYHDPGGVADQFNRMSYLEALLQRPISSGTRAI